MADESAGRSGAQDAPWTEDEQQRLESGLMKAAAVCELKEKWKLVAKEVGTRDAKACAVRYKACREAMQEERRRAALAEQESQHEANQEVPAVDESHASSSGQASRWNRSSWWNSEGGESGWWSSSSHWQSWQGSWEEPRETSIPESEKRAIDARKEVEANRERMRLKAERAEEESRRKEAKAAQEAERRAQEKQEQIEEREKQRQAVLEQQRQKQQEQIKQEQAWKAKAAGAPYVPQERIVGGRVVQVPVNWAAKAAAKQKTELARRQKEEKLEKQAAEALAAIASSGKKSTHAQQSSIDEESADTDDDGGGGEKAAEVPSQPRAKASPIGPPPKPRQALDGTTAGSSAASSSAPQGTNQRPKKKWWSKLDGDCPISLTPLGELDEPPFGLEADGSSAKHYFDARFLASWLLSTCDFIDPVNRRPLTYVECKALDDHLRRYHPSVGDSSVADAFALFEKNGLQASSEVHSVQREATAVLQHLFRFSTGRLTDRRGRAINYTDSNLTVVDDDDVLAAPASRSVAPARSVEPNMQQDAFPQLAPEGASGWTAAWTSSSKGGKGAEKGNSGTEAFPSISGTVPAKAASPPAWGPKAQAKLASGKGKGRGKGGRFR